MKDFIGVKVMFMVDGMKMEGIVVADKPDRVLVKDLAGKITRIIKSRISLFCPERETEAHITLQLLACHNKDAKCSGVMYVVEGEQLTRPMFEAFMKPCPLRTSSCQCGTKGDLRTVSSATLKSAMCGVLFGDYPEVKEKKNGNGTSDKQSGRQTEATPGSAKES